MAQADHGWRDADLFHADEIDGLDDEEIFDEPTDPVERELQSGIAPALDSWIPLVTARPGQVVTASVPSAELEWAGLAATRLVTCIRALAEWARMGPILTSTGAMRPEDMRFWCTRWGLSADRTRARSMWDVADIALPWQLAIDCDLIAVEGRRPGRSWRDAGT